MARKKRSALLRVARKMPPLYHTIPGQDFDVRKSRVIWWLTKQPEILNWMWNNIKQSEDVKFDPKTGKWQGVDFHETD